MGSKVSITKQEEEKIKLITPFNKLVVISFLLFSLIFVVGKSYAWSPDYSNWQYQEAINITSNTGEDIDDYVIGLVFNTTKLIDEGKLQPDCRDLRFAIFNETSNKYEPLKFYVDKCKYLKVTANAYYRKTSSCISSWSSFPSTTTSYGTTDWREDIWNDCDNCDFYSRIYLTIEGNFSKVYLYATSDDKRAIWVNGEYYTSLDNICHSAGASCYGRYDITNYIHQGSNEIRIWCSEKSGGERCNFYIMIDDYTIVKNGEYIIGPRIWVKVPYIKANDNTTIYMYYGNPFANKPQYNYSDIFYIIGIDPDSPSAGGYYSSGRTYVPYDSRFKFPRDVISEKYTFKLTYNAAPSFKTYEGSNPFTVTASTPRMSCFEGKFSFNDRLIGKKDGYFGFYTGGYTYMRSNIQSTLYYYGGYLDAGSSATFTEETNYLPLLIGYFRPYVSPEPSYEFGEEILNPTQIDIYSPRNQTYRLVWFTQPTIPINFTVYGNASTFYVKVYEDGNVIYENENYANNTNIVIDRVYHTGLHNVTIIANNTRDGMARTKSVIFSVINFNDWQYRKEINITEQSGNNLLNYQVKLTIDTATLISEGKMNSDCSDIRFTYKNSTGEYKIPYWIESSCNSANTIIWVKVPEIPANNNTTTYMYYGNPNATSESNPNDVFILYDDFSSGSIDTSKWTTLTNCWSITTATLPNGETGYVLKCGYTGSNQYKYIRSKNPIGSDNLIIEGYIYNSYSGRASSGGFALRFTDTSNHYLAMTNGNNKYIEIMRVKDGGHFGLAETGSASTGWSYFMFRISGNSLYAKRETIVLTDTDSVITTGNYVALVSQINDVQGNYDVYFWDIRVRKYVSTEPTYSIGAEEQSNMLPQITIYSPSNQTYHTNQLQLNFAITDDNSTTFYVKAYFNDSLIYDNPSYENNTNIAINLTSYITTDGTYYIKVWANDSAENNPQTNEKIVYFTIATSPYFNNITTSPSSPQTYGLSEIWFNVSISDIFSNQQNVILETNLTKTLANYTMLNDTPTHFYYHWQIQPAAGTYSYRFYANDTAGNWNISDMYVYVVNKLPVGVRLYLNGNESNLTINYPAITNQTAVINVSGLTFYLARDGEIIKSGEDRLEDINQYRVGVYNFTAYYPGDENHTSSYATHFLIINKGDSNLNLISTQGWSIYTGTQTTIYATADYQTPHLIINGVEVNNPYSFLPQVGFYDVYAYIDDYENFTDWNISKTLIVNSLPTCVDNATFAFEKVVNVTNDIMLLNFSHLISEHYVKDDLGDVYIPSNVSDVWRNGDILVVNASGLDNITVRFGNYYSDIDYEVKSIPSGDKVDMSVDYNQANPYALITLRDELTAKPLYPPGADVYAIIGCSLGESIINIKNNTTTFLIASKKPITEISVRVKYTADAYYRRTRLFDNLTAIITDIYVGDAYEVALDRIDLVMANPDYYNAKCQIYKQSSGHDIIVTEGYFDASHTLSVYLVEDTRYNIRVIDSDGNVVEYGDLVVVEPETKEIGSATLNLQTTTQLIANNLLLNAYRYDNTTIIHIDYRDSLAKTQNITIYVYNSTNNLVYSHTYNNAAELHINVSSNTKENRVVFDIYHDKFNHVTSTIYITKQSTVNIETKQSYLDLISLFILLGLAGLVSVYNFTGGVMLFDIALIILKAIGWLSLSVSSIAFLIILSIISLIAYIMKVGG